MTHVDEEQLIAYALEDVDAETRPGIDAHLESCGECRSALEELRRVLVAAADIDVPERGDDYGAHVWARLEPALPARPGPRAVAMPWRGWLAAAAVLILAIGAFVAGRWSRTASEAPPVAASATTADSGTIRERVVLAALSDHLDRTERGLMALVNESPDGTIDISAEQAWARDLLEANRLYRQSARGAALPSIVEVLGELEPILLTIVHSPSRLTALEFHDLRSRIEDRSLVFKVRVTGADVRARQQTLVHPGEKTS